MAKIEGVDVASYQPVDYPHAGIDFAFVKSTQGTGYVNPEHDGQIQTILTAKGVPGHYHFMSASDQATAQANFFHTHTKVGKGHLIAVDWEPDNGVWPTNSAKDALIRALKALYPNNKVGLYTNRDGWLNQDRTSYCGDFLWIADPDAPEGAPRIQHAWTFHQYGENNGEDLDVANFQTVDELKNWAGVSSVTYNPNPTPVTNEPGFGVWDYKNPEVNPDGSTGQDAWAKLVETHDLVKKIAEHLGVQ